jgi:transcriptional repressor NF-X1
MKIKCSDELTQFVCQNKCDKILSCKKHKCTKPCHVGPCKPCALMHMASCYCGKNDDVISC